MTSRFFSQSASLINIQKNTKQWDIYVNHDKYSNDILFLYQNKVFKLDQSGDGFTLYPKKSLIFAYSPSQHGLVNLRPVLDLALKDPSQLQENKSRVTSRRF